MAGSDDNPFADLLLYKIENVDQHWIDKFFSIDQRQAMCSRAIMKKERLFALSFFLHNWIEWVPSATKKLFSDPRIAPHMLIFPGVRGSLLRLRRGSLKEAIRRFTIDVFPFNRSLLATK